MAKIRYSHASEILQSLNLTQCQLAECLRVSQPTVCRLLKNSRCTQRLAEKISKKFGFKAVLVDGAFMFSPNAKKENQSEKPSQGWPVPY